VNRLRLGEFRLIKPVARGGMAQVWHGVHERLGVPVAVKIITTEAARDAQRRDFFRNEVRAVAALDHPGAVIVYDHGEVDGAAADASNGLIRAGSPFLVMEYASGGTLSRVRRPMRAIEVRDVALALLDVLAHAHARGVIHRDIKAGNVLVCTERDVRPGLKLTDFGIAHAIGHVEGAGSLEGMAGTLAYMAPEQVLGRWRDYGPWTDLYGLGCLIYRLLTGQLPFAGLEGDALARAQVEQEVPVVPPNLAAPGFAAWIARLVQKPRNERFDNAADAAWALLHLQSVDGTGDLAADHAIDDHPPADLDSVMAPSTTMSPLPPARRAAPVGGRPPIPSAWQVGGHGGAAASPLGVGLGLHGLRTVAMVGREEEREHLWGALRSVDTTQEARAVVITGGAGVGKSRLVEWLAERSQELGAATVLSAEHGPLGGPAYGVRRMLARYFRAVRLRRDHVRARIDDALTALGNTDRAEVDALLELVSPAPKHEGSAVRIEAPEQAWAILVRFLRLLGRRRPVVLCLEDVQWSSDAVDLVAHLISEHRAGSPVLVVMTARDSALADVPEVAARLDAIASGPAGSALHVGTLDAAALRRLVEDQLGLEPSLAAYVEERSSGNPLFAIQLVSAWVQAGQLEIGTAGLVLVDGARGEKPADRVVLPASLHDMWALRIDRIVEGLPEATRVDLERAAALGTVVDDDEWALVCGPDSADRRLAIRDRLAAQRLARVDVGSWTFRQPLLRESIERSARAAGRWADHHRACADMLLARSTDVGIAERLGRHLVEADLCNAAIGALLRGVRERKRASGVRSALSLLRVCEDAMHRVPLPPEDARWGEVMVVRAELYGLQGQGDQALGWGARAVDAARAYGWANVLVRARIEMSEVLFLRNDLAAVSRMLDEALAAARGGKEADPAAVGRCLHGLARVAVSRRDDVAADALLREAIGCYFGAGQDVALAGVWRTQGDLARARGEWGVARMRYRAAQDVYVRNGRRHGVASCLNELAELDRAEGNLEAAASGYRAALREMDALGLARALLPALNLGLVHMAQGAWDEARRVIGQAAVDLQRRDWRTFLGAANVMLAACAAARSDWAAWERHLGFARGLLMETRFVDADICWSAELAGQLAARAGEPMRACEAWRIALAQAQGLRDAAAGARIQGRLASVGGE
jgi:tetratricopeptide (TPR) repeat protein